MNPKYTIQNFRVFDREGATFELAPLTILTGCNSSGKSSMAKSLLLLDDYITKLKDDKGNMYEHIISNPLEFSNVLLKLGRFDVCLNNKAEKGEPISLGFEYYSNLCFQRLKVIYTFNSIPTDDLNNGWLSSIELIAEDGTCIERIRKREKSEKEEGFDLEIESNYLPLKDAFIKYALALSNKYAFIEMNSTPSGYFKRGEIDSLLKYTRLHHDDLEEVFKNYELSPLNTNIKFPKSFHILGDMIYKRLVYILPILYVLEGVSKEDIRSKFDLSVFDKNDDDEEKLLFLFEKIITDFENSDFDNFIDYYRYWEEEELQKRRGSFSIQLGGGGKFVYGLFTRSDARNLPNDEAFEYWCNNFYSKGKKIIKFNEEWPSCKELLPVNFNIIFNCLMYYSVKVGITDNNEYVNHDKEVGDYDDLYSSYRIETSSSFFSYCGSVLMEAQIPSFLGGFSYVGSDRATVRRLYSLGDKTDAFDELLLNYIKEKKKYLSKVLFVGEDFSPGSFINEWLQKFELGHSITFKNTAEGLGLLALIHKDEQDIEGHLLADEGYGITQLLSILLNVEMKIMKKEKQSLANFTKQYQPSTIIIEEPETHLHPRFQSLLAEMFVEVYKKYNIHFIIETHSEYLIRKLQTYIPLAKVNEKEGLKQGEISLYYLFDPDPTKRPKEEPQVKKIDILDDGCLASPFGTGFYDEAINLSLSLYGVKF